MKYITITKEALLCLLEKFSNDTEVLIACDGKLKGCYVVDNWKDGEDKEYIILYPE